MVDVCQHWNVCVCVLLAWVSGAAVAPVEEAAKGASEVQTRADAIIQATQGEQEQEYAVCVCCGFLH